MITIARLVLAALLTVLMLAVADATAAARWYAEALGATYLWNLGGVVGLTVAGAPFFLGEPENNGWDTPAALGSRTVRVEVFVDDPDGFIDRAVTAGADGSVDKVRVVRGEEPFASTAVSFNVGSLLEVSVMAVALGVVTIVGLAGLTTTCSLALPLSLAGLLFVSLWYVAFHWYVPVTVPEVGSV